MNPTVFFYGLILANVSRWTSGAIAYETFQAANRTLWDAIQGAHLTESVLRLVRRDLPAAERN